jgi:hypothetical protein
LFVWHAELYLNVLSVPRLETRSTPKLQIIFRQHGIRLWLANETRRTVINAQLLPSGNMPIAAWSYGCEAVIGCDFAPSSKPEIPDVDKSE